MSVKSKLMKLIPAGLVADRYEVTDGALVVAARSVAVDAPCPDCGVVSGRVHSRYQRTLRDLPAHGRRVVIQLSVRRFRCAEPACRRQTFAEPLASVVDGRYARRTARSDHLVHRIAVVRNGG